MGAEAYDHEIEGYSSREAFRTLCEDVGYERGYGSYNGSITTCSYDGRVITLADKFSATVEKKAYKYINDHDYGKKWDATCLDLGVVGYDVIKVEKSVVKSTKKAEFRMKYCVIENTMDGEKILESFDTKTDADKYAMTWAAKKITCLKVVRKPINVNKGDATQTKINVKVERKTTKPRSGNYKEVHKYIFFGWASC